MHQDRVGAPVRKRLVLRGSARFRSASDDEKIPGSLTIAVTLLALLVFGYIKGRFTVKRPFRSAWQTAVVGGLAAAAAFVIAKLIA